ncbi:hypothetical protein [Chitinophaga rhizophila]|uniref:DUF4377 domain-containing protein n=1 Tax=Chitinophaga rhizophila TaxID=2866212 RepID=A0ABS7G7X0_9BACT|nr:hypothetical protein [Chitinophaga rhizophila]MBW8683734.1 hypothetical protein [Chitinophaga rhizophila]
MKSLLLLPMLLLGLVFSSCTKEYITQEAVIPNRTIQFDVQASAWQFDSDSKTWYAPIPVPEIDDYANRNSGILVYISSDKVTWEAIPDVFNGSTFVYTYKPGTIYLEVQRADGATIDPPTSTIYTKVVIVESDPI